MPEEEPLAHRPRFRRGLSTILWEARIRATTTERQHEARAWMDDETFLASLDAVPEILPDSLEPSRLLTLGGLVPFQSEGAYDPRSFN